MIGTLKERKFARKNLTKATNRYQGICETLRIIYDLVYDLDKKTKEKITEKLIDAMIFAKKMSDRLAYYKETYHDSTGHQGKNIPYLLDSVKRQKMRRERHEHD